MRRSRRGGGSGLEFGSSGEDSFVAVVVTKLTGALLFILLLTMVIMALLPKAVDIGQQQAPPSTASDAHLPLEITTPSGLPEGIAGRTYVVALAATGGRGRVQWSSQGPMPEWLALDTTTGQMSGTPPKPTDEPIALQIQVSDGTDTVAQPMRLAVLPAQSAETANGWWRPRFSRIDLGTWLEQGIGFLVLWLVHLLGMNLLANLERNSLEASPLEQADETGQRSVQKRYALYRVLVRLTTVTAMAALAVWIVMARGA
jgi:hypothetical protein